MLTTRIASFAKDEHGATAIEYALIAALIAMALVTALTSVGTSLSENFQTIADSANPAP
ncbi:MAG: Flp family type IVb pilin [Pseudomonadota bacterium]